MGKLGKILVAIALVVVTLVIGLVVLAKIVITPERVKQTVLPIAEDALQRKVELGDISVSLFTGIELNDLKVYEKDGKDVFVGTKLVRLKYQLLPLLAMKVVIDEVRVESPRIRVVRTSNGQFSFDDVVGGTDKKATKERKQGDSATTPISLLVSQVSIEDGSLVFIDHTVKDKTPHTVQVSELQVTAKGITLTGSVPVAIKCKIDQASLKMDGAVSLLGASGEFGIKLEGLDALAFGPYLKDSVPGKLEGLKVNLESKVTGGLEVISADGTLKLTGLDLTLDALPDAPLKNARIEVGYDLSVGLKSELLDLRRGRVDYNGLVAEATGTIKDLFGRQDLVMQLTVPGIDLRQAMQSLPAGLVSGARDLDPSGTVKLDAQLAGGLNDPVRLLRKAVITLDNVQVAANGQRPAILGLLKFAEDKLVSEGLEMRMGENRASIAMSAGNLFGKTIIAKADVTSERFQLEPLLSAGGGAGVVTGKGQTSVAKDEELGPFDLPLQASGKISIGKALYKGLFIDDFIANYQLKDNVLTISRMDGNIAGGSFSTRAQVNLGTKGLTYSADLAVKTIQADPLLTAFIPKAAGALFGAMDLDLNLKGRGTQWESLSKQLNGQGDMQIANGRVVSPGLVKGFASFLQLSNTDEIRFRDFQGDIRIVDGKLNIDSRIFNDDLKLFPKGSIGLDGTMNLSMDTRLSPQLAARLDSGGNMTKYLADKDGWSQVPLLVSGNYASPKFGLDPKGLQKQASEALGKELGRHLDKLFGSPDPAAQKDGQVQTGEETKPVDNPTNKSMQDSLKKLFGN